MRSLVTAVLLALASATAAVPASAAVSVSIGLNIPAYPRLVGVPGYPVYYAPDLNANYFFYDGLYWYFDGASWYDSPWYNGPWTIVDPFYVPTYILRVPVRYYHRPPAWFHGWNAGYAPRWHEHWGHDWSQRRGDWQRGEVHASTRPAPLPSYQQRYSGNNYPSAAQQAEIHSRQYNYHPREQVARQRYADHAALQQQQAAQAQQQQTNRADALEQMRNQQQQQPQQRHEQREQRHEQQRDMSGRAWGAGG